MECRVRVKQPTLSSGLVFNNVINHDKRTCISSLRTAQSTLQHSHIHIHPVTPCKAPTAIWGSVSCFNMQFGGSGSFSDRKVASWSWGNPRDSQHFESATLWSANQRPSDHWMTCSTSWATTAHDHQFWSVTMTRLDTYPDCKHHCGLDMWGILVSN